MIEVPKGKLIDNTHNSPAWTAIEAANGGTLFMFRCTCGTWMRLVDGVWTVAPDGTVSPSVWHNVSDCGFHDFIKLGGYENA